MNRVAHGSSSNQDAMHQGRVCAGGMGVSDAVDEFERDTLTENAPLAALVEASTESGQQRMRALASQSSALDRPTVASASRLKRAIQEAEIVAVLDEYARSALALIRPADQQRWRDLIAEAQQRSGAGFLADELGRSALGASLLRDRLGGDPNRPRQARGVDCACGYAIDGVLPKLVCPECGDVLLRRWVAEEYRLLRGATEYSQEIGNVIEETAVRQAKVYARRGDHTSSETAAVRKRGGRRLARLGRKYRADVAAMDRARWASFVEPLARDARTGVRTTAAGALNSGLGAASLTDLALVSEAAGLRVAARILEKRLERTGRDR